MGEWEKARYRNVKRNYEALLRIGEGARGAEEPAGQERTRLALARGSAYAPFRAGARRVNFAVCHCGTGLVLTTQSSPRPLLRSPIPPEPVRWL